MSLSLNKVIYIPGVSLILIIALLISLWAAPGVKAWSSDPTVNTAISTASNDQLYPAIVSDGSGGAIITWNDYRSGTYNDIYAQRVDASGSTLWAADGVGISTASNSQINPQIVSDGSGGAIITWQDNRSGTSYDIYAQRVNASGTPQWTADGVAISTASNDQYYPQIASDGSGGAIITWHDYRSGTSYDIYAQRVNSSGTPQWTANGVAISIAPSAQDSPTIASDGSGGAIITWQDWRNGTHTDIYAQRVNASGSTLWASDGEVISTASGNQWYPTIVSDDSGGAIITWQDRRGTNTDIYAQRVDASGTPQWTADGVGICTYSDYQNDPQIVSDGSGGAIITWEDERDDDYGDIYAQRVNSAGAVQWTTDGVGISTLSSYVEQDQQTIASDGSGGAIITWQDDRGNNDIYAQRVNASGTTLWTTDGVAISTASSYQDSPAIVSDGSGGAVITWHDRRSGYWNQDIYAQRVYANGTLSAPAPSPSPSPTPAPTATPTPTATPAPPPPPLSYTLNVSSGDDGLVTDPGEGLFGYYLGTVVDLLAVPDDGYAFVNWTGDVDTVADPNAADTTITMDFHKTIIANFTPALVSIEVTPDSAWIAIGQTQQFTAIGTYSDGSTADITDQVAWVSDGPAATIDGTGLATGVSTGSAGITASLDGITSDPSAFNVADYSGPGPVVVLTIDSTVGGSVTKPSEGSTGYGSGQVVDLLAVADEGYKFVNWTGDVDIVADPNSADTTITMDSNKSITANFAPLLVSIEITSESASVNMGETQQYTAIGSYYDGSTADITALVTWASDNPAATIDDSGLATGVAEGTAGITASLDEVTSDPSTLVVTPPVLVSIEVTSESDSINVGDTQQYTATGTYSDGSTADITAQVTWDTDESVVTMDAGSATGVGEGTTTLTAILGGVTSGPATLAVNPPVLVSIEVTPAEADALAVGQTQQFTAIGTYSDGTTVDITVQVTWNTDESVASFDNAGLATGVAAGTIEVSATLGGITSNPATLTVSPSVPWSVVGGIIAASFVTAFFFFLLWRRRKKKERRTEEAPA